MAKNGWDPRIGRLLDANANRAREGIRVVEDAARFILGDKRAYQSLRALRHALGKIEGARNEDLLQSRDSEADAGRKTREKSGRTLRTLVIANFKRAQEATRALEEYGKLFSRTAPKKLKAIRFELYSWEKKMVKKIK